MVAATTGGGVGSVPSVDAGLIAQDGVVAELTARDVRDAGGGNVPSGPHVPGCVRKTEDYNWSPL